MIDYVSFNSKFLIFFLQIEKSTLLRYNYSRNARSVQHLKMDAIHHIYKIKEKIIRSSQYMQKIQNSAPTYDKNSNKLRIKMNFFTWWEASV